MVKEKNTQFQDVGGVQGLLRAYAQGRRDFARANLEHADLSQTNLSEINLCQANLQGANLSGTNLTEADLTGASLQGANLTQTILRRANLKGSNLRQAILKQVDWYRANLSWVNLSHQDLSKANLSWVDLQGADLSAANLSEANLKEAKLDAANLRGAIFNNAILNGAYIVRANLVGASLKKADLSSADLTGTNLEKCVLDGSNLRHSRLRKTNLQQASLRQAYLRDSNLYLANLTDAILQKADLDNAKLDGACLKQADLRGAEIAEAKEANLDGAILGELEQSFNHRLHLEFKGQGGFFAFSPNSERLAYVDWNDLIIQIDLNTGEAIDLKIDVSLDPVVSVVFSANGRTLYRSYYVNQLKLWNPYTGELVRDLKNHSANITSLVLDGNANYLGINGTGEPFQMFDVGHETRTFKGYSSGIQTQAHSPDGRLMAGSSPELDGQIELCDRQTQRRISLLSGHKAPVQSLAFSPDSKLLASTSAKDTKIWLVETREENYSAIESNHRYNFSPRLAFIQTDFSKEPILMSSDFFGKFERRNGTPSRKDGIEFDWNGSGGGSYSAEQIALSADKKVLARLYDKQPIQLWNLQTGEELDALDLNKGGYPIALSSTGNILAVGNEREFSLWDVQTKTEIYTLIGHSDYIRAIAFSPDDVMVASGDWHGTIKLWNVQTGGFIKTLQAYSCIDVLAFSLSEPILASGSRDGTIKIWNLNTMEEIHSFRGHQEVIQSLSFSPDGKWLTSSDRSLIRLWKFK